MLRKLTLDDLSRLPALHEAVWGLDEQTRDELLLSYELLFPTLFLNHPWPDRDITSLVIEEDSRLVGLQGVVPRTMTFRGRHLRVAISTQLCVDLRSRSRLAGIQLIQGLLSGPQDLTIADMSNTNAARVWSGLGGLVLPMLSQQWVRVLKPCQTALSFIRGKRVLRHFSMIGRPFARAIDGAIERLQGSSFQVPKTSLRTEPLSFETFHTRLPDFTTHATLQPDYTEAQARWIWNRAPFVFADGSLQRVAVIDERGRCVGWFFYQLSADGFACVSQLVAFPRQRELVLAHLLDHASRHNAVAVTGRTTPDFLPALAQQGCVFHQRGKLFLAHTRDAELRAVLERGDLFFSGLEGEGCLSLAGDPICQHQAMSVMMPLPRDATGTVVPLAASHPGDASHEMVDSVRRAGTSADRTLVADLTAVGC